MSCYVTYMLLTVLFSFVNHTAHCMVIDPEHGEFSEAVPSVESRVIPSGTVDILLFPETLEKLLDEVAVESSGLEKTIERTHVDETPIDTDQDTPDNREAVKLSLVNSTIESEKISKLSEDMSEAEAMVEVEGLDQIDENLQLSGNDTAETVKVSLTTIAPTEDSVVQAVSTLLKIGEKTKSESISKLMDSVSADHININTLGINISPSEEFQNFPKKITEDDVPNGQYHKDSNKPDVDDVSSSLRKSTEIEEQKRSDNFDGIETTTYTVVDNSDKEEDAMLFQNNADASLLDSKIDHAELLPKDSDGSSQLEEIPNEVVVFHQPSISQSITDSHLGSKESKTELFESIPRDTSAVNQLRDVPLEGGNSGQESFDPNLLLLQMHANQFRRPPVTKTRPEPSPNQELIEALNMLMEMRDTVKEMMPVQSISTSVASSVQYEEPERPYSPAQQVQKLHYQVNRPQPVHPTSYYRPTSQYMDPWDFYSGHNRVPYRPYYIPCYGGASTSTSTSGGAAAAAASAGGCGGGGSTSTSTSAANGASTGFQRQLSPPPVASPLPPAIPSSASRPQIPAIDDAQPPSPPTTEATTTRSRPFRFSIGRRRATTTPSPRLSEEEYTNIVNALSSVMTLVNGTRQAPPGTTTPQRTRFGLFTPLGGLLGN